MPWWTRESSRQILATPLALTCLLVPGDTLVKLIAGWDIYAVVYLSLTWFAYRGRKASELPAMARASQRTRLTDRVFATAPEQLSQGAAAFALVVTVIAMPQARDLLPTSPMLVLALSVVAVLTSWLVLQVGFALHYMSLYAQGGGLEFPGGERPAVVDFVYFSVAVGTTFGTTDVTITERRVRRQVLMHGIIAFFFNTLILAVAVTIVTSYVSGA